MIASLSKRLFDKLLRKPYRDAYVAENVRTGIAYQIRALRLQRGWQQQQLASEMGKPQSVVSRLEDPDYGRLTVKTLLEVASAFDVALMIQYVSFPEFIWRTRDVSPEALAVESFKQTQFRIEPKVGAIQNRAPLAVAISTHPAVVASQVMVQPRFSNALELSIGPQI